MGLAGEFVGRHTERTNCIERIGEGTSCHFYEHTIDYYMQSLEVLILIKQSCNQDDDHSPLRNSLIHSYMRCTCVAHALRRERQVGKSDCPKTLGFSLLLALQNLVACGMRHATWFAT